MSNTKASLLEVESTLIEEYPGDTAGQSIVVTAKGTADKGETAQQYGQHGLISNPAKNTIGLRLTQGSLDIIIGGLNYSVPLPENMGETLLFSTDAEGVVKSKLYLDAEGNFIFNDGEDFAVRYSALETAYDQLKSEVDQLITDINTLKTHTHTLTTPDTINGSTTAILPVIPPQPSSTGDITGSKIEEILVP